MSAEQHNNGHIDYREAFVIDMELVAHGPACKQCILAALHNKPDDRCDRMKHLRGYITKAYEALPPYYKERYEAALKLAFEQNAQAIRGLTNRG